ncbi:hypothetical protein PAXRUDRAFT_512316 [Paxillus rubicundulus Ve08.2h10]|uniref:DH domain-containing protein n=1 Tax=Paxillus rubicundulus Ve08.2h10 TaxID=930991 RepID=A0A0D0DW73_9AGAM|nr:hypothetical protein PAXRUDRAFT_512316 [Paxillus rubicundulus Ve08.2h10]
MPDDATLDSEDAVDWQAVRKALLCIREIVRTERKYQEALKMLVNSQTVTPPPPSMLAYVPGLIQASEMLLKGFVEDPSAWGVSTAFMTCEDEVEAAMVSWCGVAGAFFTGGNVTQSGSMGGRWRLRNPGTMLGSQPVVSSPSSPVAKQSPVILTPQLPSMLSLMNAASSKIKERQRMDEDYWRTGESAIANSESQTRSPASFRERDSPKGWEQDGQPHSRRLSVRDLAIQPTQRVMRYVLLYRDLLDCTPSISPSRPLVERALEAATRIASKCDRAQRNPAFSRVQT